MHIEDRLDKLEAELKLPQGGRRREGDLAVDLSGLKQAFIDNYVMIDWDIGWLVRIYDECDFDHPIIEVRDDNLQTAIYMAASKL